MFWAGWWSCFIFLLTFIAGYEWKMHHFSIKRTTIVLSPGYDIKPTYAPWYHPKSCLPSEFGGLIFVFIEILLIYLKIQSFKVCDWVAFSIFTELAIISPVLGHSFTWKRKLRPFGRHLSFPWSASGTTEVLCRFSPVGHFVSSKYSVCVLASFGTVFLHLARFPGLCMWEQVPPLRFLL